MGYFLAVVGEGVGENAADGMTVVRSLLRDGFWALHEGAQPRRLTAGDKFVIYVTKGGGVGGFVGTATVGGAGTDLTEKQGNLIEDLGLAAIMDFRVAVPISSADIWNAPRLLGAVARDLTFIRNKKAPGWYVRCPFQRLSDDDYRILTEGRGRQSG
jgi:hypothetical protein